MINFGNNGWVERQTNIGSHWEPFWRFCSVCHEDLMPDYILKFDNLRKDIET